MFWQYDPRLVRRWNQNPKPNPSISNYAVFANNPIWYNDPLGDTIKSTQEGFDIVNEGFDATLGSGNPFDYDASKGVFTYDKSVVSSNTYNDKQQDIIDRFSHLITSAKDEVNVKIVNGSDKVFDGNTKSLNNYKADGITTNFRYKPKLRGVDYSYTSQMFL